MLFFSRGFVVSERYIFDIDADMYYDTIECVHIDVNDELISRDKIIEELKRTSNVCPCGCNEFLCGCNKR